MAHTISPCIEQNAGRRRIFWTTRPDACGEYPLCGSECVIPGLRYEDKEDDFRTINNDDWLTSLILNILNTRARTDLKCPSPAAVFGHWSESYRKDGLYIGSTMWNAAEKSYTRVNDGAKAIGAAIKADMGKLIAMKVVDSVDVQAEYRSGNRVQVVITAVVTNTSHVLNLSGVMSQGTWVWH